MPKQTQTTIKEELAALTKGKTPPISVEKKDVSLFSDEKTKGKRGGWRNGGRPLKEETIVMRGIREHMNQHANEEIDITVTDPKTGKTRVVKKPRSLILLEILFTEAFQKKNVAAIKEWLDRAVGKPAQPIRGDGDSDAPIRMEHDISSIIAKAYGDDTDNGED